MQLTKGGKRTVTAKKGKSLKKGVTSQKRGLLNDRKKTSPGKRMKVNKGLLHRVCQKGLGEFTVAARKKPAVGGLLKGDPGP